jgi:DNA-binding transcriptional MerR regulator
MQFSNYNLSEQDVRQLLSKGGKELFLMYSKLIEKKFHVGETEVARKNLHHWQNFGLLPYPNEEEGWAKFSLVEYIWLKMITELRAFGVRLEKIKEIKSQLFDYKIEDFKTFFLSSLETYEGEINQKEMVINMFKRKDIPDKFWEQAFAQMQISNFSILILQILILSQNFCLIIDEENKCSFITLGKIHREKRAKNEEHLNSLLNKSFTLINIRKIITQFFENEKINHENEYLISFLNKNEKEIINKINEGQVKEIKISFRDDKPTVLKLTKSIKIEDAVNKMSRILKKGAFQEIVIKTTDGKLTYYEQTDIIKLK